VSRLSPPWPPAWSGILHYAIAVFAVAAAGVSGLLVLSVLQSAPFVSLFLCAILLVSWIGGAGPGLLATGLSSLGFVYFFIPPTHSFALPAQEVPRVALFAVTALFVVWVSAAQRRTAASLQRARDDLRVTVQRLESVNKSLQAENAERTRAEQSIRQAERELQMTIDTIPASAARYRSDGSLDFVNQPWRTYTGLSQDNLRGQRWGAQFTRTTSHWLKPLGALTCRPASPSKWSSGCGEATANIGGIWYAVCLFATTTERLSGGMVWASISRTRSGRSALHSRPTRRMS